MADPLPSWLPKPDPNVERFKQMLRRQPVDRVPLIELAIADETLAAVHGGPLLPLAQPPGSPSLRDAVKQRVQLWRALGYDYYRARVEIPFVVQTQTVCDSPNADDNRAWANEHTGLIRSIADIARYSWPAANAIDFSAAEAAAEVLPEGMGLIGFSGGVLEWTCAILGLEHLMLLLYDDPPLVQAVVDRVGQIIYEAFRAFCDMPAVFALWLGDDLGFKTATLLQPAQLRHYILPWHKRYAELAHSTGRLFLLHSCGRIDAVMQDLIRDVRIDAKHSFEDVIQPVEQFQQQWGRHIAVLGGVDVDLLSRGTTEAIRARTEAILTACAPGGGYACGSGNSIPNYIPPQNYLAMIEAVHRFNARA